jgi:hypothetical protein
LFVSLSGELALVDAVALHDLAAHEADPGVDGGVVLQRPAELARSMPMRCAAWFIAT